MRQQNAEVRQAKAKVTDWIRQTRHQPQEAPAEASALSGAADSFQKPDATRQSRSVPRRPCAACRERAAPMHERPARTAGRACGTIRS
jgi:hypothetical protein